MEEPVLFTLLLSMSILFSRLRKPFTRLLTAMKTLTSHLLKLNICYITCSSEDQGTNGLSILAFCHVTISSYLDKHVLDKLSLMFLEPNPSSSEIRGSWGAGWAMGGPGRGPGHSPGDLEVMLSKEPGDTLQIPG